MEATMIGNTYYECCILFAFVNRRSRVQILHPADLPGPRKLILFFVDFC